MTSVPKPLKFLRPHYAELAKIQASWPDQPVASTSQAIAQTASAAVETVAAAVGLGGKDAAVNGDKKDESQVQVTDKGLFADILSVLAMTYSDTGKRETLMYRLKGGSDEDPGVWGHEYVR